MLLMHENPRLSIKKNHKNILKPKSNQNQI